MQVIVLFIGCICTLIILVHLYMSEIDKHTLFRVSEKVLLICILIATVFFGVIPEIVMVTHKQQYDIAQDLLHTSGKVYDANKHTVDIEIEDVGQVDILSVDNYYKTDDYYIVYYVRVDVEVPQGYLRGVPVIVEKNIFGTDTIVKWDYSLEDKMFYYENMGRMIRIQILNMRKMHLVIDMMSNLNSQMLHHIQLVICLIILEYLLHMILQRQVLLL
ncbi:hypothetical protein DXB01_08630 [Clostridium sp. OF10-22XD]|nr:hypothetical protein DXB01_08630 [Clostridium sp. OF10-22XD]